MAITPCQFLELKATSSDASQYRVRLGKTRAELSAYNSRKKVVFSLNTAAKEAEASYSFSLRENGEIWKFQKNESGPWKRVKGWIAPEVEVEVEPPGKREEQQGSRSNEQQQNQGDEQQQNEGNEQQQNQGAEQQGNC